MSSETSTEAPIGSGADALQPWQLFTLAGLVGATIVVFMARGESPAGVIVLSLIIFTAAAVGVAALRALFPLTGSATLDAPQSLGGRTRVALEREKALVLRTIKELEFDRAMGKVSEKDFAEMSLRLRARATGLMRQLDAGAGYRAQIEREIARRTERAPDVSAGGGSLERDGSGGSTEQQPPSVCSSCRTKNDSDARFCKKCGEKLEARS